MIEDNIKSNSSIFIPFFLKSHSSDGTLYLSRENSSYDTKLSSQEFQLQFGQSFSNLNGGVDNKLTPLLSQTHYSNSFNKIAAILQEMKSVDSYQNYLKLSECFFEIVALNNNSQSDREDYLKALKMQNVLIGKMIEFVKKKTE
mgnify:CR=1 FL=1